MSKLADSIERLVADEVKELEARKSNLTAEIEKLDKGCIKLKNDTEKEIAQKTTQCEAECNQKTTQANALLKEAQASLETAKKREEESLIIEKQIKELDKKAKSLKDYEKELETLKISYLEKEKKAQLTIEQYNKKIGELNTKK